MPGGVAGEAAIIAAPLCRLPGMIDPVQEKSGRSR